MQQHTAATTNKNEVHNESSGIIITGTPKGENCKKYEKKLGRVLMSVSTSCYFVNVSLILYVWYMSIVLNLNHRKGLDEA